MVLQLFRFCFDNWNCMDWTGSASWTEFPFVASNIDGNTSSQSRRSRVSYLMISLRCVQVHRSSPKYIGKYSLEHLLYLWYPGLEVTSNVLHCISWIMFLRSLTNTFGWSLAAFSYDSGTIINSGMSVVKYVVSHSSFLGLFNYLRIMLCLSSTM